MANELITRQSKPSYGKCTYECRSEIFGYPSHGIIVLLSTEIKGDYICFSIEPQTEPLSLEKTLKTIESSCRPATAKSSAEPCPWAPHYKIRYMPGEWTGLPGKGEERPQHCPALHTDPPAPKHSGEGSWDETVSLCH